MILVSRGDKVYIKNGRLIINPVSGKPIPKDWIQAYELGLVRAICKLTAAESFTFKSFKTGKFGDKKLPGVCLLFEEVNSSSTGYVIFNVQLDRLRNSRYGQKGEMLPPGRFRVTPKSSFYKFWKLTGLKFPPRLSSFHDYMGNLKPIYFTGEWSDHTERLHKSSLRPLNISYKEICQALASKTTPNESRTRGIQACHTRNSQQPLSVKGYSHFQPRVKIATV